MHMEVIYLPVKYLLWYSFSDNVNNPQPTPGGLTQETIGIIAGSAAAVVIVIIIIITIACCCCRRERNSDKDKLTELEMGANNQPRRVRKQRPLLIVWSTWWLLLQWMDSGYNQLCLLLKFPVQSHTLDKNAPFQNVNHKRPAVGFSWEGGAPFPSALLLWR